MRTTTDRDRARPGVGTPGARRRHPAHGARIVAAGASAAAVLAITAALGFAQNASAQGPPTTGLPTVSTPPVVTTPGRRSSVPPATLAPRSSIGVPDVTTHGSR
jgi:hypothetical protein